LLRQRANDENLWTRFSSGKINGGESVAALTSGANMKNDLPRLCRRRRSGQLAGTPQEKQHAIDQRYARQRPHFDRTAHAHACIAADEPCTMHSQTHHGNQSDCKEHRPCTVCRSDQRHHAEHNHGEMRCAKTIAPSQAEWGGRNIAEVPAQHHSQNYGKTAQ
jgi:hypothetical protein